jgi:demethylspheroidene O-methyltransferase
MSASQRFVIEELLASYDFSAHRQVLDIGGGKGGWVLALAQKEPSLKLHLMDLPPVAALAAERMQHAGVSDRVTVHGGSFISHALPSGADLVTLVRVAHDHPDAVVKALLGKIYQMLPSGGRLLLAEPMAQPSGEQPAGDAYFHFYLLAMGSGRLRSSDELRSLMLEAGFDSVEPVSNPMPLHTRLLLGQKR